MKYFVLADSGCDRTVAMKSDPMLQIIPCHLQVGNLLFEDDDSFDQAAFLRAMSQIEECPRSACPAVGLWLEAMESSDADVIFAVTLSSKLSGSYNSAVQAAALFSDLHPEKFVHVFSSDSAAAGETKTVETLLALSRQELAPEEIVKTMDSNIAGLNTLFALEDLSILKKNGRLTGMAAVAATALGIKPILAAGQQGKIVKLGQTRGMKKAIQLLADHIVLRVKDPNKLTMILTYCGDPKNATLLRQELSMRFKLKRIELVAAAGISTMYAQNGGVVAAF